MKPVGVQLIIPMVPPGRVDPDQLVGDGLVVRREHRPDAGQHDVEARVGERQRLGIGLDPLQPDTRAAAAIRRPASNSSGVRSEATTEAPVAAAGIAALPDPAATSSTRWPARTPHASTSVGPSVGMRSAATAG